MRLANSLFRSTYFGLLSSGAAMLLVACSGDREEGDGFSAASGVNGPGQGGLEGESSVGESDQDGTHTTLGEDGVTTDDPPDTGKPPMECPEERECGEDCCDDGQLCYAGQCFNDCGDGNPGCGEAPGECCSDGEICYLEKCVMPGGECGAACPTSPTSDLCGPDEVCDPVLERCMPKGETNECTFEPPPGTFDPVPLFTWGQRVQVACTDGSECERGETCEEGMCTITWPHIEPAADDVPASVQSVAIPLVIDLDQDCVPEIVFISNSGTINGAANVRAIRGDNGAKVWTIDDPAYAVDASGNLAAGDIDGDGLPEVIGESSAKELVAFDSDGTPLWKSDAIVGANSSGSVAIADLDGKGRA